MDTESLPLFAQNSPRAGLRDRRREQHDPHLRAARKLAKAIRRTADRSPQQQRAGRLICQHLIAMLNETVSEQDNVSPTH